MQGEVQLVEEIRDLQIKTYKAAKIKNIILIVFVAIVAAFLIFASVEINRAMKTVEEIDTLVVSIEEKVDALDVDTLNDTITTLNGVTKDLETATNALDSVVDSFAGFGFSSMFKK